MHKQSVQIISPLMIIWLASYPKSGNTWVRSFLCHYIYGNNNDFSFELLNNIKKFPDINVIKNLKIDFENTKELIKNWNVMQDYINLNNKLNFLKTHNAFCTINGNSFTNSTNTLAAIYVVRDPRDVLVSFSNHFNLAQNRTLEIMKSDEFWETESKYNNFRSSLFGSWKTNYESWLSNKTLETLVIRYEDLILEPFKSFCKIIKFLENKAKVIYDEKLINFSMNQTNFQNLSRLEKKNGFDEATNDAFFRKGYSKQWVDLDKKLIINLKESFGDLMKELNYI